MPTHKNAHAPDLLCLLLQFRAYSKRLSVLPGASAGGGSGAPILGPEHVVQAPVAPGDDLLAAVGMDYGRQGYVDPVREQVFANVAGSHVPTLYVLPVL